MPDDERPAKGKTGPPAYSATLRDVRAASERAVLNDESMPRVSDEAPHPLPQGEPANPPKRRPGHEAPDDAF